MASFDYVLCEACLQSCGISNLLTTHSICKIICTVDFSELSTSVNTPQLPCLISHQGAITSFSDHISNTTGPQTLIARVLIGFRLLNILCTW